MFLVVVSCMIWEYKFLRLILGDFCFYSVKIWIDLDKWKVKYRFRVLLLIWMFCFKCRIER